jgi:hypothetical protein
MLNEEAILKIKERIELKGIDVSGDLLFLLTKWSEVKSAPAVKLESYDTESRKMLSEYVVSISSYEYDDYREDPWFGFEGEVRSGREENALALRILDASDMVHDLILLSEEVREEFSFSFSTIREAEDVREFLHFISAPSFNNPVLLDETKAEEFIRNIRKKVIDNPDEKCPEGYIDWKSYAASISKTVEKIREYGGATGILSTYTPEEWPAVRKKSEDFSSRIADTFDRYHSTVPSLFSLWSRDAVDLEGLPLEKLEAKLEKAREKKAGRYSWKEVYPAVEKARENGIITFIHSVFDSGADWDEIIPAFDRNLVKDALDIIYSRHGIPHAALTDKPSPEEVKKDVVFPVYEAADIPAIASSLSVSSFSDSGFPLLMEEIIKTEAPVFERDLMRRLSFLGGEEYLTTKVVESYRESTQSLEGKVFLRRRGFLYSPSQKSFVFRRASLMRDFSHIAPEELEAGMYEIIRNEGPIEKEKLYSKIGSLCGYSAVLKSRWGELDAVLSLLVGKIEIGNDTIKLIHGGEK